jgi:hypothetical protein
MPASRAIPPTGSADDSCRIGILAVKKVNIRRALALSAERRFGIVHSDDRLGLSSAVGAVVGARSCQCEGVQVV